MIHITDSQTDRILDVIDEDEFWDDKHYKSLKDTLETYDFTTFADKRFSEHLAKRNRIIIPDEDGKYVEFVIENTRKYRDLNGGLYIEVYTSATYIELTKAKIIKPQTTPAWTAEQHAEWALAGTEWEVGDVDFSGSRTLTIEQHTNPYAYLKRLATEFDLELHFRVEIDGTKVARRYVDLIKRVGVWQGREVEFGKDLIGIERKEDFSNIVTALIGLGPERDDGTRLEVFVEDKDALARWGRNGQHIVDVYEPESTDQTMTEERLRELTKNELEKRINSIVEYTADIADLEKVPGLEHEKIRFGDTIKIKDTAFTPALYLEARVHTVSRSIKQNGYKTVTLGDYIEYTEEQVFAIWKALQAEIAKKVSLSDVMEVTYTKTEIDDKDAGVYQDSTQYSDIVSETKKQEAIQVSAVDATNKAQQAENNAKSHANSIAEQKKQEAINAAIADAETKINAAIADAETKINAAKSELEADIALKADAEWVNGQLVLKENAITKSNTAPANPTVGQLWLDTSVTPNILRRWDGSAWVKATPTSAGEVGAYTKTEVDNALNSKVSVTQYNTDMNGVVTRLDSAESRITQTENEIATKVSNTTYQQDKTTINNNISQLQTKMSNAETSISQLANQITLKANASDVYTKTEVNNQLANKADNTTVNVLETRISEAEAQLTIQADQIATKVSQTTFTQELSKKENAVTKSNSAPSNPSTNQLWLDTSVTPNVLKRWNGSAWVKATPTTAGEVGAYTKSETDSRLATKANQSDLNTLTTRVSTTETSITQLSNQIALKANATDVYTKSQIDGRFNTVNQQISQLDAELSVQAGEIATKVSKTEFDALQIGGRNWLRGTGAEKSIIGENRSNQTFTPYHFVNNSSAPIMNKTITVSFDWRVEGAESPSGTFYVQGNNPYPVIANRITLSSTNKSGRVVETRTITGNPFSGVNFRLDYVTEGAKLVISNMKIEIGNRATDWTPAPEDTQSQIDGLGTRVSSAETSITQLSNQIQLKANQTTVDTLANRISSAESTINLLSDEIDLKVNKNGVISAINVSSEGVRIDGAKVRITGQTTIDNGVIKTAHIGDGQITNAKIANLSFNKLQGGTATLGGNGNGNGLLQVLDANNNLIFRADQNGIVDGQNRRILGAEGLLSTFNFMSSGPINGWQECAWWGTGGVYYKAIPSIRFFIPDGFVITKAELRVYSLPVYWQDTIGRLTQYIQPRGMVLFKLNDYSNQFYDYPLNSDNVGIAYRSGSAVDITQSVWGVASWNADESPYVYRILARSGDITNHVRTGYNEFYIDTFSGIQTPGRNTGLIQFVAVVQGYQKAG